MSTVTHIYGASDDLIEVTGAISDELYPDMRNGIPDGVCATLADGCEVILAVLYDRDGRWHLMPQTHEDLVTITPARGEDEPDDADGCPGYSDKATIANVQSIHLTSQEGDR